MIKQRSVKVMAVSINLFRCMKYLRIDVYLQQIETLIMKVKFISKKEREQLKSQRVEVPSINYNQQKPHVFTEADILKQYKTEDSTPIKENNQKVSQTQNGQKNMLSEHMMAMEETQKKEDISEVRERSRDNKFKEVSRYELDEQNKMKSKVLGLTKMELSARHNITYRNQLLFEWDKSQDTSQNFVPLIPQEKAVNKTKDILETDSQESWKNKPFTMMTERDWRIFRQDHQIYIRGGKAPNPVREWKQIQNISDELIQNLLRQMFQKPKPIQMQAIPIGMSLKDLMAIAPTGEGKTLAYLLPIVQFLLPLERLNMNNFDSGPYALILVPTRQLAEQIDEEFKKITKGMQIRSFVAVGGKQFQIQSIELSKGCDILIATPGRVKQFLEKHQLSLQRLSWCIIDEADKMVSQNLGEDLQFILERGGESSMFDGRKIIHMFSATMIPQVQKLGKEYLSASFTYITIGEPGGGKKEIDQHVELIDANYKPDRLTKILRGLSGPIIVFVNSRENCDKISMMIQKRCDRSVAEYHGGKNQEQRERVISQFRAGKIQILVATDLAGRGLDVKGINAIINYDAPKNISQFVHRAGRTGRAGMKGKAYTLLTSEDQGIFYDLRTFLQRNGFNVPENIKEHPAAQVRPGGVLQVARRKQIVYTN